MAMPTGDDFIMEETVEKKYKKALDSAKTCTMGFLGKAASLYKRAMKGDPSPTLVGKAIAYLTCFQELAPEVGIKRELYTKILTDLLTGLGKLSIKVDQDSRKTIIEHRGDPEKVALETRKLELREKELEIQVQDNRKPREAQPAMEPGTIVLKVDAVEIVPEESVIKEVSDWLVGSQLKFERNDAQRRARIAYQPGVPIEELVARACRIA